VFKSSRLSRRAQSGLCSSCSMYPHPNTSSTCTDSISRNDRGFKFKIWPFFFKWWNTKENSSGEREWDMGEPPTAYLSSPMYTAGNSLLKNICPKKHRILFILVGTGFKRKERIAEPWRQQNVVHFSGLCSELLNSSFR